MNFRRRKLLFTAALAASVQFGGLGFAYAQQTIINVSYDPTRELYREFNEAFAKHWQETKGGTVRIQTTMAAPASRHAP